MPVTELCLVPPVSRSLGRVPVRLVSRALASLGAAHFLVVSSAVSSFLKALHSHLRLWMVVMSWRV